jgi:hypothetical protein
MRARTNAIWALVAWALFVVCRCDGAEFIAYSLSSAEKELLSHGGVIEQVQHLGGITHLAGAVYDARHQDWVLVGQRVEKSERICLDDLVVAMKAVLVYESPPEVSIDPMPTTPETRLQKVVFKGGIENTQLGKNMLDCDVLLKELALEKVSARVWGVESYLTLRAQYVGEKKAVDRIGSRFWFKNLRPSVASRPGVCALMHIDVGIETELLRAEIDGKLMQADQLLATCDTAGDTFCRQVAASFDDLQTAYPALKHVRTILALVSLAQVLHDQNAKLDYWLHDYRPRQIATPSEYRLIETERSVAGTNLIVSVSGGLELRPITARLKRGWLTAFEDVVLSSRPSPDALVWYPPLDGWRVPGVEDIDASSDLSSNSSSTNGFSLDSVAYSNDPMSAGRTLPFSGFGSPSLRAELPRLTYLESPRASDSSTDIGGVMLSGAARVEGAQRAENCLTSGNFALVVDGKDARIDPLLFRKFVTALWCVYYSPQDPGISIDPFGPMGPDSEKHLVRYIGRVINTDLGRVMRDADYIMKKWAVGTERPKFPNFRPVDGWMAKYGASQTGVSRRFWFVPEDIRFTQSSGLLLFESGRMRLNTEYDEDGMRGKASRADEEFAEFFTEHYTELAAKYPVYKELFDYAKLVALAKHLKDQGVPLHWFLLAHKDLVITEDSPGTVDQLAKGSEYFRGMTIMGGVDLNPNAQYVYDQAAMEAIQRALAAQRTTDVSAPAVNSLEQRPPVVRRVSFDLDKKSYTVVPQSSLTAGKDHRGLRYQTDVALRSSGQAGLELVRYYDPRSSASGQFGRGWHLLIPYRVKPDGDAKREFLNARIPERMVIEDLLGGRQEVLSFSADRYAAAGYVPDKVESSQVVGLFLMSNGSFRLADKLGNQFHFDPSGRMADMFLSPSPEHHLQLDYADEFTAAFAQDPYKVRPASEDRVPFLNVLVPRQVEVTDLLHDYREVLTFDAEGDGAGYRPANDAASRFPFLSLLSNGGLQMTDSRGNQVRFDPGWDFESLLPAPEQQMVRRVVMGNRQVTFGYTINQQGEVVIATSAVADNVPHAAPSWVVRYEYDAENRLCRVRHPGDAVAESAAPSTQSVAMLVE